MKQALDVDHGAKRFDQVQAVADISFRVNQGELFGFLGPNGAGKTTTIGSFLLFVLILRGNNII